MSNSAPDTHELELLKMQVLVIGGGPAGLAAAKTIANSGLSVVLVDENAELGGQYYRQRSAHIRKQVGDFRRKGREIIDQLKESEIIIITSSFVFAADDNEKSFYVFREKSNRVLKVTCDFVIVATGSQEMVIPYLGWETPKCITPGMASRIFDIDYVDSNKSVVIGGSGPFLLSVAANLIKHGVDVKSVFEYHKPYTPSLASLLLVLFPTRLFEFLNYRWTLWRAHVPVHSNYQILKAEPTSSGIKSTFVSETNDSQYEFETDYLAVSYGFLPNIELSSILDLELLETKPTRSTKVSTFGKSSKEWVYVVGESVNVQGWRAASIRGRLSALHILQQLQNRKLSNYLCLIKNLFAAKYEQIFTQIRKTVFQENQPIELFTDDDLMICRCESVSYNEIKKYLDQPWSSASGLKAETRIGMGTCQGKQCGYALSRLCANSGKGDQEIFTNIRIPLRPVPVSTLISLPDKTKLAEH